MITIRKADQRGHANHGWLNSRHTFSFAGYHDPRHMGFRALRVINEDRVRGGAGFGSHPHRDMEILSFVLDGAMVHRDNMGHETLMPAGSVQRMTAGSGVVHSEMNASANEAVHFLQVWIQPESLGLPPSYEQLELGLEAGGGLIPVATRSGRDGSLSIHQDVEVLAARLGAGESTEIALADDRHAWLQVVRGAVEIAGERLEAGDGAAWDGADSPVLTASGEAEVILFDLA